MSYFFYVNGNAVDAARIEACEKACDGISTAALESGVVAELVAACEAAQSALAVMVAPDAIKRTTVPDAWAKAIAAEASARAAVAKAKGE